LFDFKLLDGESIGFRLFGESETQILPSDTQTAVSDTSRCVTGQAPQSNAKKTTNVGHTKCTFDSFLSKYNLMGFSHGDSMVANRIRGRSKPFSAACKAIGEELLWIATWLCANAKESLSVCEFISSAHDKIVGVVTPTGGLCWQFASHSLLSYVSPAADEQ
tara:strand:- start:454 stop:939 length:486 start_codon:yes stop_codon:yes gene_type:complete